MDFRRRDRVVTGQNVAGENRERKRLIAGAVKIAAGELIVFIERMIDLPMRLSTSFNALVVTKMFGRPVLSNNGSVDLARPRVARQQSGNDGVAWTAERRDFARIRNRAVELKPTRSR